MASLEMQFSEPYNRDVGGNTIIDRYLEQNLEVFREGAEKVMKFLIEIGQIVLVSQILYGRLRAFAARASQYHDRFPFGNAGLDGDEGIVFYQFPGLLIIFGDEFPFIPSNKVLVADRRG